MPRLAWVLLTASLSAWGGPLAAVAQPAGDPTSAAVEDNGRFSFHRVGEGFVRLDTRSGQLSQCGWAAAGWSCKAVPDERAALDSEISRLQRENGALKKVLLSRGIELPAAAMADAAPAPPAPVPPASIPEARSGDPSKLPSDAEVDRAIAYMKNVWRKLVEMMNDLQRDIQRKS